MDHYLTVFERAPERPILEYRHARILYEHGLWAEAAAKFARIVERDPKEEVAVYSANLLLDCDFLQHDMVALRAAAVNLQHSPVLRDAELAALIKRILAMPVKTPPH